jgi:hypothetical protein
LKGWREQMKESWQGRAPLDWEIAELIETAHSWKTDATMYRSVHPWESAYPYFDRALRAARKAAKERKGRGATDVHALVDLAQQQLDTGMRIMGVPFTGLGCICEEE